MQEARERVAPTMLISDVVASIDGARLVAGRADSPVGGVAVDSRKVVPGDVFVAIAGFRDDGARYAAEAVARGAAAVVTADGALGAPEGAALVRVPDARFAAARIACLVNGDPSRELWVTGVTGTNGKTTTTFLVRSIYRCAGLRAGLLGTVEFDLAREVAPSSATTPEPIELQRMLRAMRDNGARGAILEVSSHALTQRRVEGVRFRVGVFTNLTPEHLDYHGDFESYAAAKELLFRGLDAGAVAVLNAADPASLRYARATRARVVMYGIGAEAPSDGARGTTNAVVRARIVSETIEGTEFDLVSDVGVHRVRLPLPGRHNVQNALAAAGAALAVGIDPRAVVAGLEAESRVPGRLDPVDAGQDFRVLVDYAHTDDALEKVLASLRPLVPGRILVVFGCGGDRDRTKRPRMGRVVEARSDLFWVTNDNPRGEDPAAIAEMILGGLGSRARARVVLDRDLAIAEAIAEARSGDAVLIAGKGHECGQIFRDRTVPFDDRTSALAALRHRLGSPLGPRSGSRPPRRSAPEVSA